jgi:hypothetical protein
VSLASTSIYIYLNSTDALGTFTLLPFWLSMTVLLSVIIVYLSSKFPAAKRGMLWVGDRLTIFLYLFLPLSLVSLIVVVMRNIL